MSDLLWFRSGGKTPNLSRLRRSLGVATEELYHIHHISEITLEEEDKPITRIIALIADDLMCVVDAFIPETARATANRFGFLSEPRSCFQ